jgi:hypothetical protein
VYIDIFRKLIRPTPLAFKIQYEIYKAKRMPKR